MWVASLPAAVSDQGHHHPDVLSGGRAWFGIGAAWNEEESRALGFPFPPLRERFEMLEETLQMAHAMWSGGTGSGEALHGTHVDASRLLNSPQSISRPRIPIMIGGGGGAEGRFDGGAVGDACNVIRGRSAYRAQVRVLREHCDRLGRPYEEIERSTLQSVDLERFSPAQIVDHWGTLAEAGAQHIIFSVRGVADITRLERIGAEVFPQLR